MEMKIGGFIQIELKTSSSLRYFVWKKYLLSIKILWLICLHQPTKISYLLLHFLFGALQDIFLFLIKPLFTLQSAFKSHGYKNQDIYATVYKNANPGWKRWVFSLSLTICTQDEFYETRQLQTRGFSLGFSLVFFKGTDTPHFNTSP